MTKPAADKVSYPLVLSLFLATLALGLLYSYSKLLWGDEVLAYYTAVQPSLHQLLHFQTTTPLNLEPPLLAILAHIGGCLFGYTATPLRLESIFAYALAVVSLFGIVRRMSTARAGYVGMLLAACLNAFLYATELRPYAVLIAMSVTSIFLWQHTLYGVRFRKAALCLLPLALALTATCHFYGFIATLPVLIGELVRVIQRRHWDPRMSLLILVGIAASLLNIPFLSAAAHYRDIVPTNLFLHVNDLADTYTGSSFAFVRMLSPIVHHVRHNVNPVPVINILLLIAFACIVWIVYRRLRSTPAFANRSPEFAALVTLSLLVFPTAAVSLFYTRTYAPRHAIEAIFGVLALCCIALAPSLEKLTARQAAVGFVLLLAVAARSHYTRLRDARQLTAQRLAAEQAPDSLLAQSQPVYLTYLDCLSESLYAQRELLPRLRCVYSPSRESSDVHHIVKSTTERAFIEHTSLPVRFETYEEFRTHLPAYVVIPDNDYGWEGWLPAAMYIDHLHITPAGRGLNGTIYAVSLSTP
jgi:hypothetical protein